jgi:hypothetical protein
VASRVSPHFDAQEPRRPCMRRSPCTEDLSKNAPATFGTFALGRDTAAALLVAIGDNPDRLRSERAFARLCGVAPIPASSGSTRRHRLHRGGNRSANQALHVAVIVRMRYCAKTRAYVARRTREGLSKPEIIRCLKRHVAREVFQALRADYASMAQFDLQERPQPTP